jgi:GAF domain-containing protein
MPSAFAGLKRAEIGAFAVRLRDLLSTVESTALLVAAETRVRGLGEHLRFACLALPCSEALVALELGALGRLVVPAIASPSDFRTTSLDFMPTGTPFAYLLSGGGGHAAELSEDDAMIAPLRPILAAAPRSGIFVPIRLGESVVGGAALLSHDEPFEDRHLDMAERLAEVLALTVESFRTERVVFELFARALPDLFAEGATTSFAPAVERYIHALRVTPEYRRRLELAVTIGKIAGRGDAEARLAADLLSRVDAYAKSLSGGEGGAIDGGRAFAGAGEDLL